MKDKYLYVCDNCGEEFYVPYYKHLKIINGQKNVFCCKECKDEYSKPKIEQIRKDFSNKGYQLLDNKYINAKTKLLYICNQHSDKGVQSITYDNFKQGCGCKYCGRERQFQKRRVDFESVKQLFEEHGMILLQQDYINNKTPLKYICKKHPELGVQYKSYNNARYEIGCPHCNSSKGEALIKKYLDANNIKYEIQKKFNNLRGVKNHKLSYDFFICDKRILLEYQGQFHDGTAVQQTREEYEIQREHDRRKKEYAEANGYTYVEIWYYDDIETKLNEIFS